MFVPLAFIEGLVGAFFFPFALTVSFALLASLVVALTAVPVLGSYLLRQGDLPEGVGETDDLPETETWLQRVYTPVLSWALRHKAITLVTAIVVTIGSLGVVALVPVNLFGGGGERYVNVDMTLPPGTPLSSTLVEVAEVEAAIAGEAEVYLSTLGSPAASFGTSAPGGFNQSNTLVKLSEDAPDNVVASWRSELEGREGRTVNIAEVSQRPTIGWTGSDHHGN